MGDIKKQKRIFFLIGVFLGINILPYFFFKICQSEETGVDPALTNEQADQLEDLEKKAKNYQRLIELKQQQQVTLQNQLKLMQIQQDKFKNGLEITKKDVEEKAKQISELENEIEKEENSIVAEKANLSEMIRTYDRLQRELSLNYLSESGELSKIFNNYEYLSKASEKVKSIIEKVRERKQQLDNEYQKLSEEKKKLEEKKQEMEEKVYYLTNEEQTKNIILEKTKGEEGKYQELLERVEQQKKELLGDIDSLSGEIKSEIEDIQKNAAKPKSGLASTSWYYSQKDRRWGYNRIGLSSSLLKDYGCAISSVAMVFTYHNQTINPGKLASQPIFYRDLIVWPNYWKGIKLQSSTGHGNINWNEIDKQLAAGNPVIVFIRSAKGGGHYVVIHGKDSKSGNKYVVHDPLFGANIFLETTKKLVGAIYNSSVTVDQMIIYN